MISVQRRYAETLHESFPTYYANFPPNNPVSVGDFGILANGIYTRAGSLRKSFGISLAKPTIGSPATFQFSSKQGVQVDVGAGAQLAAGATGSASGSVKFGAAGAVFFVAAGCRVESFPDELLLRDIIRDLYLQRRWESKWALVTQRVSADALNMMTAEEEGAFIEFQAQGTGHIDFTDAAVAGRLREGKSRSIGFKFVAAKGTTPFVKLLRVRRTMFGRVVHVERAAQDRPEDLDRERERLERTGEPLEAAFEGAEVGGDDTFGW